MYDDDDDDDFVITILTQPALTNSFFVFFRNVKYLLSQTTSYLYFPESTVYNSEFGIFLKGVNLAVWGS